MSSLPDSPRGSTDGSPGAHHMDKEDGPPRRSEASSACGGSTSAESPTVDGTTSEDWNSITACSECTIPVRGVGLSEESLHLQYFELEDGLPIQVIAAIKGSVEGKTDVAVRIHSECFTGDVLRSAKCDCGLQLEKFFGVMAQEDEAVLLYVKGHEGRGIGLAAKMTAYKLQCEEQLDTVDSNLALGFAADLRSYVGIAHILVKLGVKSVRLFTNNPQKIQAVESVLPVTNAPLRTVPLAGNREYLRVKEERMQHMSTMEATEARGGAAGTQLTGRF